MLSREEFIKESLEHNLFFARIIKEHLIFAVAFLAVKNPALVEPAMDLKEQYESLLAETVRLSNQAVSREALNSGQFITPYTLNAEMVTQGYTGIPINTGITQAETAIMPGMLASPALESAVAMLNQTAIVLTTRAVAIKTTLGNAVKACQIFTFAYPALLEHVLHEAEFYLMILNMLQRREDMHTIRSVIQHEIFWNHIMEEHSEFIRGMLDPSEKALIKKANSFAEKFEELTARAKEAVNAPATLRSVTADSMRATAEIRTFKAQGTQGILACKIKSIILPLLSDHVLREASHYLQMLRMLSNMG